MAASCHSALVRAEMALWAVQAVRVRTAACLVLVFPCILLQCMRPGLSGATKLHANLQDKLEQASSHFPTQYEYCSQLATGQSYPPECLAMGRPFPVCRNRHARCCSTAEYSGVQQTCGHLSQLPMLEVFERSGKTLSVPSEHDCGFIRSNLPQYL